MFVQFACILDETNILVSIFEKQQRLRVQPAHGSSCVLIMKMSDFWNISRSDKKWHKSKNITFLGAGVVDCLVTFLESRKYILFLCAIFSVYLSRLNESQESQHLKIKLWYNISIKSLGWAEGNLIALLRLRNICLFGCHIFCLSATLARISNIKGLYNYSLMSIISQQNTLYL